MSPFSWLGIGEHRFRTVRWYRDDAGTWQRIEPWMTTFTDLASGQVIGAVDGRDSAAVKGWLKTRPRWWRHRVRVVAIDPSAAFRSAVRSWLPEARGSVDHLHLVMLANAMLTAVRRRVSWDIHDRSGGKTDPAWAHRLLLRGYDTVSARGRDKLADILATDDPTHEISAASKNNSAACWPAPPWPRREPNGPGSTNTSPGLRHPRPPGWLRMATDAWWPEIETFIQTRANHRRRRGLPKHLDGCRHQDAVHRPPRHAVLACDFAHRPVGRRHRGTDLASQPLGEPGPGRDLVADFGERPPRA